MFKLKPLLSLLMLGLAFTILPGCNSSTTAPSAPVVEGPVATAAKTGEVTFSVYFPGAVASKALMDSRTMSIQVGWVSLPSEEWIDDVWLTPDPTTGLATATVEIPVGSVEFEAWAYGGPLVDAGGSFYADGPELEVVQTAGEIVEGSNTVVLTFLAGDWQFVDASDTPINLTFSDSQGGTVSLNGFSLLGSPYVNVGSPMSAGFDQSRPVAWSDYAAQWFTSDKTYYGPMVGAEQVSQFVADGSGDLYAGNYNQGLEIDFLNLDSPASSEIWDEHAMDWTPPTPGDQMLFIVGPDAEANDDVIVDSTTGADLSATFSGLSGAQAIDATHIAGNLAQMTFLAYQETILQSDYDCDAFWNAQEAVASKASALQTAIASVAATAGKAAVGDTSVVYSNPFTVTYTDCNEYPGMTDVDGDGDYSQDFFDPIIDDANSNGVYDLGESFTDYDSDGVYDSVAYTELIDGDGDGDGQHEWLTIDVNSNGRYDAADGDEFEDYDLDGVFDYNYWPGDLVTVTEEFSNLALTEFRALGQQYNSIYPLPPSLLDSDNDGLVNSVDTDDDNDGLTDDEELALGTDPLSRDTDVDGVEDLDDAFPTDEAASLDSDGDGYPDSWNAGMTEVDSTTGLVLDFAPSDPNDWVDTDGDGVGDFYDEFPNDPTRYTSDFVAAFDAGMTAFNAALLSDTATTGPSAELLLEAAQQFSLAATNAQSSSTNAADAARFYGSLSRVVAVLADTQSDGVADGLNTTGDVLDGFGLYDDFASRDDIDLISGPELCRTVTDEWGNSWQECTPDLPTDSPTTGDLITFIDSNIRTQLEAAYADLDTIAATFEYTFADPGDGMLTDQDYGDVLFLKAIIKGLLGQLAIDRAYDLNVDLDALFAAEWADTLTIEQVLADHPTLGTLSGVALTELLQAKADLRTGFESMQLAVDFIEAETDDQTDDMFTFLDTDWVYNQMTGQWEEVEVTSTVIADTRDSLTKALTAIDGPVTMDDNGTPDAPDDDFIFDVSAFFAGVDIRSLLPGIVDNEATTLFPDPTLGGIVVQAPDFFLNTDRDSNGIPDWFGPSVFYEALIAGHNYQAWAWSPDFEDSWTFEFDDEMGVTAFWGRYSYIDSTYTNGTATGSAQILPDGNLGIVFFGGQPANITDIVVELRPEGNEAYNEGWPELDVLMSYNAAAPETFDIWWQLMDGPLGWGELGITDQTIVANNAYVQTRQFESGYLTYRGWVDYVLPDLANQPASSYMFHELELTNGIDSATTDDFMFTELNYYKLDCRTEPCTESWSGYSGFTIDLGTTAPPVGTYTYTAATGNGTDVTTAVAFTNAVTIPNIESSTMSLVTDDVAGNVTFSWTNPTGGANWGLVSQIRLTVKDGDAEDELLVLLPATATTVTIPFTTFDLVGIDDVNSAWRLETRAYDANNMNYSRSYSTDLPISAAPVSTQVTVPASAGGFGFDFDAEMVDDNPAAYDIMYEPTWPGIMFTNMAYSIPTVGLVSMGMVDFDTLGACPPSGDITYDNSAEMFPISINEVGCIFTGTTYAKFRVDGFGAQNLFITYQVSPDGSF